MKKFICMLMTFCIIFAWTFSANAIIFEELTITNDQQSLYTMTQNMKTGEITYSMFDFSDSVNAVGMINPQTQGWCPPHLERMNEEDKTVSVCNTIGEDNRVKVSNTSLYPYSAVCYMEVSYQGTSEISIGTAFMVGDNIALTAAHCIYEEGYSVKEVKVWPGKDGYGLWNNPFGTAEQVTVFSPNWGPGNYADENDWAIIVLDDDIGNSTGWFGFEWQHADAKNRTLTISGYPVSDRYYQYTASDMVVELNQYHILHRIDTGEGQSGAPLYNSDNIVYGIHTQGYDNSRNMANRITLPIYNYIVNYINNY